MTEKLTLLVPPKFKHKAHLLSHRRKKGICTLFVEHEAKREKDLFEGLDGVWEGRDIILEQLREKAWSRE